MKLHYVWRTKRMVKKNGTIHHEAITDKSGYCPIKALAYRIQHILSHGGDDASWLCDYWDGPQWRKVTVQKMTTAVKNATIDTKLYEQGITPKDVSSHSLRAGGAMALKLNGASDTTIKKQDDGPLWRFYSTSITRLVICHQVYRKP